MNRDFPVRALAEAPRYVGAQLQSLRTLPDQEISQRLDQLIAISPKFGQVAETLMDVTAANKSPVAQKTATLAPVIPIAKGRRSFNPQLNNG